ncbi:hypothetical protein ROV93_16210 [Stenotrophomonas maltophilia group sp. msm4]|uniref:hypothetical protein n=1 Tax=Stenotrophomonas maltophilia group TaxID=995085 RepID=UPI0015DD575C|nr:MULTISPECIES: hypothetical protein [Stenotrophomonas maltophilia group]MDT3491668.1 hypothetical protein [Stenotrophomonas maltophilia group sp. msm4]
MEIGHAGSLDAAEEGGQRLLWLKALQDAVKCPDVHRWTRRRSRHRRFCTPHFQYAARDPFAHTLGVEDIGNAGVALRVQRHRHPLDAGDVSELSIAVGTQLRIDPGDCLRRSARRCFAATGR